MTEKPTKTKVIRIFGSVVRPTNWLILLLGLMFVLLAFYFKIFTAASWMEFAQLLALGLTMMAQGYEVIKEDELDL